MERRPCRSYWNCCVERPSTFGQKEAGWFLKKTTVLFWYSTLQLYLFVYLFIWANGFQTVSNRDLRLQKLWNVRSWWGWGSLFSPGLAVLKQKNGFFVLFCSNKSVGRWNVLYPTQNFGILPPESDDTLWLKLEGDVDFGRIVCPNYVDTSDFWVLWHLVALT